MSKEDTQFKEGKSGNPKGRPLGARGQATVFDDAMKIMYKKAKKKGIKDMNDISADIVAQLMNKARAGNMKAIEIFLDRSFGKPLQSHEHGGQGGGPINHVFSSETMKKVKDMQDRWTKKSKKGVKREEVVNSKVIKKKITKKNKEIIKKEVIVRKKIVARPKAQGPKKGSIAI